MVRRTPWNVSDHLFGIFTVLFAGVLLGQVLPTWGSIGWYHGVDGRLYFTNLPPASPSIPLQQQRSFAPTQRPGAEGALVAMHRLAQQYNIDPHLVQAIITVESNFNPRAVSRAGALGLMQLMPGTAARYQVGNPFNPEANIEGGIRYLRDLFQLFPGDLRLVLAAYNAGEGAVQQHGGIPPYPETQRYVTRVMELYGAGLIPTVSFPPGKIYRYRTSSGAILFTNTQR